MRVLLVLLAFAVVISRAQPEGWHYTESRFDRPCDSTKEPIRLSCGDGIVMITRPGCLPVDVPADRVSRIDGVLQYDGKELPCRVIEAEPWGAGPIDREMA